MLKLKRKGDAHTTECHIPMVKLERTLEEISTSVITVCGEESQTMISGRYEGVYASLIDTVFWKTNYSVIPRLLGMTSSAIFTLLRSAK